MNRGTLILVLVAVLVVGGFLSSIIIASGPGGPLPVRVQTLNPEGSTMLATPNQAVAFLIYAGFAVGSLVGIAAVLGIAVRWIDGKIAESKAE